MQLSAEQDRALCEFRDWLKAGDQQVFRLFGPAGTGKTTLARYFAESEGLDNVKFCSFTGKSAHVLRQKGCPGATTIHALIYRPKQASRAMLMELETAAAELHLRIQSGEEGLEDEYEALLQRVADERDNLARPMFSLNLDSDIKDADLVVIDEGSFVDTRVGQDLLSFDRPILVLADPAQLPPVRGAEFFTDSEPDFQLTEIHRQARDNPIIRMATLIRESRRLPLGQYGQSSVIEVESFTPGRALEADQILVGKNDLRRSINARMRELLSLGTGLYPVPGDKVVCLRNDHNVDLLNGSLWRVLDIGEVAPDRVHMSIEPIDQVNSYPQTVEAHAAHFLGTEKELSPWVRDQAQEFTYGYALTTHKAQGSQWDDVVVFDQGRVFPEPWRWLYTAVTRAAERVTVVRGV